MSGLTRQSQWTFGKSWVHQDLGFHVVLTGGYSGTRFVLSRDELLTLPEFVLLSLFPNGLFPEGHMNGFSENDAVQVDVSGFGLAKIVTGANPIYSMIRCHCSTCWTFLETWPRRYPPNLRLVHRRMEMLCL